MRSIRRRRLEKKTDYKARFNLLKSGDKRVVVRKTNRYIITQIVETDNAQDKVVCTVTSRDLLSKGWPKEKKGSLKNLQASYLTGFLLGKKAIEKQVSNVIFDIGMHRNVHKSRIFAALKGALDAGLKIPHNKEALPTEKEINKVPELNKKILK